MLLLTLFFFVLSWMGTGWYRRYALTHQILDIPNHRSAHAAPIPRGGGLVFVSGFLCVMFYNQLDHILLPLSALGIALVGYYDDKFSLSAGRRLTCHVILSAMAISTFSTLPGIPIGLWSLHFNAWTMILGVLYLVWMLNLYNFMDGINGIAGCEALCVTLGMTVLYGVLGLQAAMFLPLMLAAGVAGFLVWNFPKAKIFMGDAGSGFLGFVFGVWSLQSVYDNPTLFWSWLILLGVFVVDATWTLLWRMLHHKPLHVAHATHAYQHAFRRYHSHSRVTLAIIVLNVVWLWPWSLLVALGMVNGVLGLCIAYIPLAILAWRFHAGQSE
ncbi:MAG: glycosyl transferase [Legionella sp.]|nr:MAG: glycosyl transferase [Legionella sp.]